MKIAVLIDAWFPHMGGGQVHAWELAKQLASKHNVKIDIITRSHPGYQSLSRDNINIIRLGPSLPFENLFGRILYLVKAFFYLLPRNYDLIHAHAFSPGLTAKLISLIKKTPVIMTIHGTSVEGFKGERLSLKEKIFLKLEKWLLFEIKYSAEISVSKDILKIKNVNKNIYVIPTGADIKRFQNKEIKKDKKFKIIFVGRLVRQKGLTYLIDAIKIVKNKYPEIKLVIIGIGPEKEKLQKNSPRNILFKVLDENNLVQEMLSSHLFVLPSLYEGSPIVLFEAWGAKLPIIATRVGGIPDFVKDGVNGYLVAPKNSKALASAIIKAINNKNLAKMGEKGYVIAKNQTWENMSEQVYQVFKPYAQN